MKNEGMLLSPHPSPTLATLKGETKTRGRCCAKPLSLRGEIFAINFCNKHTQNSDALFFVVVVVVVALTVLTRALSS